MNLPNNIKAQKKLWSKGIAVPVVLGVGALLTLIVGSISALYLTQQSQDNRQGASTITSCASVIDPIACNDVAGCNWKIDNIDCTMSDCNANKKGCVYTPEQRADCTLDSCFASSSCQYHAAVPAQTARCSTLSENICKVQKGCDWISSKYSSCSVSDCSAGKSGCSWSYTKCTLSDCGKSGCSCNTVPGTGECSGPNLCAIKSASSCTSPCSWSGTRTTTTVSGSYQSGCSGSWLVTPKHCGGGDYEVVSAQAAYCTGSYVTRSASCSNQYQVGSCTGTPLKPTATPAKTASKPTATPTPTEVVRKPTTTPTSEPKNSTKVGKICTKESSSYSQSAGGCVVKIEATN